MQFTVAYEKEVYHFVVWGEDYREEFELDDVNEAKTAVWELMDEIAEEEDDPFEDLFTEPTP